jgi:hypothetical protein
MSECHYHLVGFSDQDMEVMCSEEIFDAENDDSAWEYVLENQVQGNYWDAVAFKLYKCAFVGQHYSLNP